MLERGHAKQLARVNGCGTIKIIQAAHIPREIRLRQNPSTSQTADAVNLRQTAGHHKLRTEVERGSRRTLVIRLQLHNRPSVAFDSLWSNPLLRRRIAGPLRDTLRWLVATVDSRNCSPR